MFTISKGSFANVRIHHYFLTSIKRTCTYKGNKVEFCNTSLLSTCHIKDIMKRKMRGISKWECTLQWLCVILACVCACLCFKSYTTSIGCDRNVANNTSLLNVLGKARFILPIRSTRSSPIGRLVWLNRQECSG